MVNCMASSVHTKEQNGNLSQTRETVSDNLPAAVESPTVNSDRRKGSLGSEMTAKDDFEEFARPRSFSDISLSSGKYVLPGKAKGTDGGGPKTSMKVFVTRKSEVIKSLHLERYDRGTVERSAERGRAPVEDKVAKSKGSAQKEDVPPPKPTLPKNYVPKYFSQELQKQKGGDETSGLRLRQELSADLMDGHAHTRDGTAKSSQAKTSLDETTRRLSTSARDVEPKMDTRDTGRDSGQSGPKLRSQRSSAPNLTSNKSFSIVYRHHDTKMQSDLLKKELNLLSRKEHVRRNSATMQQRLLSEDRDKSDWTGKERGREQESNRRSFDGSGLQIDGDRRHSDQNRPVLVRQSKSYDHSTYRSEVKLGTLRIDPSRNLIKDKPNNYNETSESDSRNYSNTNVQASNSGFREGREISTERNKTQTRSKSASNLSRNVDKNRLTNTLGSNPKNAQMSRSTSNLRRKQDTIRKFNSSASEQKRNIVRQKYQGHGGLQDTDDEEETNHDAVEAGSDRRVAQNDTQRLSDAKNERPVGDNRSDEEKYAALSRNKILHSKSSSLDAQRKKDTHRNIPNHLSIDKMKDLKRERTGAKGDPNKGRDVGYYRSKTVGAKGAKLDDEVSVSDSEYVVNKGSRQRPEKLSEQKSLDNLAGSTKVVLRQCRVGDGIAFGLVGVKDTKEKPNGNGYLDGQGLVTIRMIPDEQGRFGFNVKGGVDQGMPIIVSRVAPNTPADDSIPRLNEGDQVLFINGRDVSQHTHEQVVMFIRASREKHTGELVLKVRPNAYSGEDNSDEPDFVYDPETHQISSATSGANALEMSLKLLEESLESGAALAQFEQLYRKKPGMTMNTARLEININKNRYRDISPYDQTRVILKTVTTGDYINANYVNMEIPVSGIVNRYIAAQGPLPTTCTDFWQMIWEQQSTLVIMLTTKVERGRVKCHQYWPDLYETSDYGHLQITCVKEEETPSFAFREFNLTHVETSEERHISHMQYIAWPDHGVPDDPADFLDFVFKVRQKRVGLVEPSVVHCSAGIGRTGVLITMETAMCLIEANQPVYPLSIVRQMRDQRAMLIQTPNQYKFVCEAIIRCFHEGIVKPLPEYQQR